jgi:hypothetical protein
MTRNEFTACALPRVVQCTRDTGTALALSSCCLRARSLLSDRKAQPSNGWWRAQTNDHLTASKPVAAAAFVRNLNSLSPRAPKQRPTGTEEAHGRREERVHLPIRQRRACGISASRRATTGRKWRARSPQRRFHGAHLLRRAPDVVRRRRVALDGLEEGPGRRDGPLRVETAVEMISHQCFGHECIISVRFHCAVARAPAPLDRDRRRVRRRRRIPRAEHDHHECRNTSEGNDRRRDCSRALLQLPLEPVAAL